MKKFLTTISFTLVLHFPASAATPLFVDATAADNFKLHWVEKADQPPVIDGKLDDSVWKKVEPLRDWGTTNYGRQRANMGEDFIPGKLDFRAAWDDTHLYIAARFYHELHPNDMKEFKKNVGDTSKAIFDRECLEIHIDGNLDHATRFQSIVNALGEKHMIWHYDFGWGILENSDYGLDADWDVASTINEDHWTVEIRYALADIQVTPKVGSMFGINPCWFNWADSRNRDGERYWWQFVTWSTHGDSHHDPRLYGRFILVENKPESQEAGLRLAFPDLENRTVMIQTGDGLVVFDHGEKSVRHYDQQAKTELRETQELYEEVSGLLKTGNTLHAGRLLSAALEKQKTALDGAEKESLAQAVPDRASVARLRRNLAGIRQQLEDAKWRIKQDILLTTLEQVKK